MASDGPGPSPFRNEEMAARGKDGAPAARPARGVPPAGRTPVAAPACAVNAGCPAPLPPGGPPAIGSTGACAPAAAPGSREIGGRAPFGRRAARAARRWRGPGAFPGLCFLTAAAGVALAAPEAFCQEPPPAPGSARGQPRQAPPRVLGWTERLELATPDGAFSIGPTGTIHYDGAYVFGPDGQRVGPRGRSALRRARLGVEGRLFRDFEYSFRWNFAGYPDERPDLNRLSLAYVGLKPLRFVVGAIKPRFTLEDSQSSNNLLFLERAAVARAASSLAGGSARYAAGVEVATERLFGAAYLAGGEANVSGDERQRGALLRLAGTPLNAGGAVLHLGVSASWVSTPSLSGGRRAVDIDEEPELRPGVDDLLNTGTLPARRARTEGVELGFSKGRFWAQAEYHRILVDRPGGLDRAEFDGWYAQAAYLLTGRPRSWRGSRGAWNRPRPVTFDPRAGEWGAVEVGLRYSRFDLSHRDVRGGRQGIWTAGVNWYPADDLRLALQYQIGEVLPREEDRVSRFQAIGLRLQTTF